MSPTVAETVVPFGVVPDDWSVRELGSVSRVYSGGTPRRDNPSYWRGSIPWVTTAEVDSASIAETREHITAKGLAGSSARVAPRGTVIVAMYGQGKTRGKAAILEIEAAMNQACAAIEVSQDILPEYALHYLNANYDSIRALSNAGGQQNLSGEIVRRIPIAFPLKPEQERVVDALDAISDHITTLDRLIAKKRDIKHATMQQLLTGRARLPGFTGEWGQVSMARDAVLKARIGWQGLTTEEYRPSGRFRLVTGTDFGNGRIGWSTCWYVDEHRFDQDTHIQLRLGDVLLTKDGTIGKAAYVDELPGPATLNSGVFVIRPRNAKLFPEFLFHILESRVFKNFLARLQAGSTISHLYQKDFFGFEFPAPKLGEQQSIAEVLTDMDDEIALLTMRLAKTRDLKTGMMQELLTGRTRLPVAEVTS